MDNSDGFTTSHMHIENSRGVSIDNSDVELSNFVKF